MNSVKDYKKEVEKLCGNIDQDGLNVLFESFSPKVMQILTPNEMARQIRIIYTEFAPVMNGLSKNEIRNNYYKLSKRSKKQLLKKDINKN